MARPVAETLRRMADTYQSLAHQSKLAGRHSEAESYLRTWEELLQAAEETEARLLQMEMGECQDGAEEFES